MFIFFLMLTCSLYNLFFFFKKKLLALLMLELCFVSLIFIYFFFSFGTLGDCGLFSMMLFLGFLVMDSVVGLCLLIVSSRTSSSFSDSFFGV